MEYFFTFGTSHLQDYDLNPLSTGVLVKGETEFEARELIFNILGAKFCTSYPIQMIDEFSCIDLYTIKELSKHKIYKTKIGKFNIEIKPNRERGHFEHMELGEQLGGGLWFEEGELVDYDGTYALPIEVAVALVNLGFEVSQEFIEE